MRAYLPTASSLILMSLFSKEEKPQQFLQVVNQEEALINTIRAGELLLRISHYSPAYVAASGKRKYP